MVHLSIVPKENKRLVFQVWKKVLIPLVFLPKSSCMWCLKKDGKFWARWRNLEDHRLLGTQIFSFSHVRDMLMTHFSAGILFATKIRPDHQLPKKWSKFEVLNLLNSNNYNFFSGGNWKCQVEQGRQNKQRSTERR